MEKGTNNIGKTGHSKKTQKSCTETWCKNKLQSRKPPKIEEVEQFWRNIWEKDKPYKEAEWIKEVENKDNEHWTNAIAKQI